MYLQILIHVKAEELLGEWRVLVLDGGADGVVGHAEGGDGRAVEHELDLVVDVAGGELVLQLDPGKLDFGVSQ